MPASARVRRAPAVLVCASVLLLAAIFWYRFWIPGDERPVRVAEAYRPQQVVTLLDPVVTAEASAPAAADSPEPGVARVSDEARGDDGNGYDWQIPAWLPPPQVPEDNPMTEDKVILGRHLFHDHRLSRDNTIACVSCHRQSLGFTDGRALSIGVEGSMTERSAMGLANVAYSPVLTWANPHLTSLERQSLVPLFGEEPVEMGMSGQEDRLFARLREDPIYQELFAKAFPDRDGRIELASITRALAAFQRTLISVDSPYDRYKYGDDKQALDAAALRGEALFFSETLECYHCHQGFNFTDTLRTANSGFSEVAYYNTGLYNLDSQGAYPAGGQGLHTFTGRASDMGKFRTQSLRNVGVTAPYFHDGSAATLDDVIDHYAAGGRALQGALAGDGSRNPFKDPLMVGFELDGTAREDLKAFLHSLTDARFLSDPRFSDPWPEDHAARGVAASSSTLTR